MKKLKSALYLMLILGILTSCEKETISLHENSGIINDFDMNQKSPAISKSVEAIRNNDNQVTGYFFSDDPTVIFPINAIVNQGDKLLSSMPNPNNVTIVSLVGDEDNFGYGGSENPPCSCYNFSGENDLNIFDQACSTTGGSWTHNFTNDPNYFNGFVAEEVIIEVREKFSDWDQSIITIDGTNYNFTVNGESFCDEAIVQTFVFTGEDAAFANDGIVNITFSENGDTIALDWARVTVTGNLTNDSDNDGFLDDEDNHPNSNLSETILIGYCDTGVANLMVANGTMMADEVDDLIAEVWAKVGSSRYYRPQSDFTWKMYMLASQWQYKRLITRLERDAIMRCVYGSNLFSVRAS